MSAKTRPLRTYCLVQHAVVPIDLIALESDQRYTGPIGCDAVNVGNNNL